MGGDARRIVVVPALAREPGVHGRIPFDEDAKLGAEMTSRHSLDIAQQVVAHPIADYRVVRGQGESGVCLLEDRQRRDPGSIFLVAHHLPEMRLQVLPAVHRSTLAQLDARICPAPATPTACWQPGDPALSRGLFARLTPMSSYDIVTRPIFGEERDHEENVSTKQPQAQKDPRIPGSHAHPGRPACAPHASPQGAQAGCCLSGASISQQRLGSSDGPIFKGCTGMASGLSDGTWWYFSCQRTHTKEDSA